MHSFNGTVMVFGRYERFNGQYEQNVPLGNQATIPDVFLKLMLDYNQFLSDPPCIRLLCENQIRLRRFLKDELKFEVKLSVNQAMNIPKVDAKNLKSANRKVGNNPSNLNVYGKALQLSQYQQQLLMFCNKADGPSDCNLCERKFVHVSGLLRHIEKHAMDLIPFQSNSPYGGKNGANSVHGNNFLSTLRAALKCCFCGQIFFEIDQTVEHLENHYPTVSKCVREYDMRYEYQLEHYVDDCITFLSTEVTHSQLPATPCC